MFGVSFGTSPGIEHAHLYSGWRKHRIENATPTDTQSQAASQPATLSIDDIWSGLSASVANLSSQLAGLGGSSPFADDSQVGAAAFGARLINKQRGVMEIHTQEGDVVTLNFRARTAVTYTSAQVSDGTTATSSSELSVSSRSRVSLQVQGDLSDEELAAINDLVSQVNDLTDTFFTGNVDAALSQAMNLSYDNTQLADYTLELKLRQSLQGYAAVVMPASNTPSTPTDVSNSTTTEPAAATAAEENAAAPDSQAAPAANTDSSASTPAETPNETTPAPADTNKGSLSLLAYREKARAYFSQSGDDIRLGLNYELKVKLLVTSIQQSAPADQVSDAAANTLTSYLTAPVE